MTEPDVNGMHNLIKLRHLDVGSEISKTIPFIGKLTFLHDLTFCIRPENGHAIIELRDLRNLHKLAIENLNEVSNPAEANEAKLNEKGYLKNLSLSWSKLNHGSPSVEMHEQLADNLKPPIKLQELSVNGYDGMRCPTWMTHLYIGKLIYLKLSDSSHFASISALGKFSLLKHLELNQLPHVKKIDNEFAFPVLKKLTISSMPELQDWDEIQGITLFPRLELLSLNNCPKLGKLPSLPSGLKKLRIENVGLKILPRICTINNNGMISPPSLSDLHVSKCPNLISLDGCMLEQLEMMQALNNLPIENCEGLVHFPSRGFIDFTSLKYIEIVKCPMLVAGSQDILLPFSLQRLTIQQSGLDVLLHKSLQNFTALTQLTLHGCRRILSVPLFEILAKLTTLYDLRILHCSELSSLSGLEAVISLRFLKIGNCDKLTTMSLSQPPLSINANPSNQLRLDYLIIDCALLVLLEPLRSLRFTDELYIDDASTMTCMSEEWLLQNHSILCEIVVSDATSLEHLPSCMDKLQMLKKLYIWNAPLIQSLPDLPPSLNYLCITECNPVLKERYKKDTGPEWHKIGFISHVDIR